MTTTWLAVEPLDTIMVRDGRPFAGGAGGTARSEAPPPSTLGGVVHAALDGRRPDPRYLVGPVVYLGGHVLFPAPADVVEDEDTVRVLAVRQRPADERTDLDQTYRLPYGFLGDGSPTSLWLTGAALAQWLVRDRSDPYVLTDDDTELWLRTPPWQPEVRSGLARQWFGEQVGTATPGMYYQASHLRPEPGTQLLVGCVDPEPVSVARGVVPLGGRGRLAFVEPAARFATRSPLPEQPPSFPGGRVAVYLATPALLGDVLWRPPDTSAQLSALALTGPTPLATASPRQGIGQTRQLIWMVPAGTVYYLTFADAESAATWAQQHHGGLLPGSRVPDGARRSDIVTAGFGTCLIGRW
jgi:CRISPR-associated protein Cmr3